jgi:hypothetical protein
VIAMVARSFRSGEGDKLPLELGGIQVEDRPVNFRIGVCKRCGRTGLVGRYTGKCAGYRAVTAKGNLVQVPEKRSVRCDAITLRRASKSNRKLITTERPEVRL